MLAILSTGTAAAYPVSAWARSYDLYRADYPKGAFCEAIGGACSADPDLENAFFQNPSALTAREPDWNFDGDYNASSNLEPGMKGANDVSDSRFMAGVGWGGERWGLGFGISGRQSRVRSTATVIDAQALSHEVDLSTQSTLIEIHIPFSWKVSEDLSLGIALWAKSFAHSNSVNGGPADPGSADTFSAIGFILGFNQRLSSRFRVGSWLRSDLTQSQSIRLSSQALGSSQDYVEGLELHSPWILGNGVAASPWEDARTFFFDLDLIGPTRDGFQLTYDTFANEAAGGAGRLRHKGRSISFEPRIGYRTPAPGLPLTTLHVGAFYEDPRWEGLSGRFHGTGGVSYKVLRWLEVMGGFDVSSNYTNFFVTFR